MRRSFFALVLVGLVGVTFWACSEATDGLVPTLDGGTSSPTEPSDADTPAEEEKPADAGRVDATTSSTSSIVINEVSSGDEWVELANSGTKSVDLSGWKVADSDKDTGGPKLSEAVVFPAGTKLGAHEYGIVQAGGVDGGKTCPEGAQVFCFNAEFGISKKNGENLYLIASDGGVVGTVVYPPDAAALTDESWARLPDRDPKGTFQLAAPTPGAPNEAK